MLSLKQIRKLFLDLIFKAIAFYYNEIKTVGKTHLVYPHHAHIVLRSKTYRNHENIQEVVSWYYTYVPVIVCLCRRSKSILFRQRFTVKIWFWYWCQRSQSYRGHESMWHINTCWYINVPMSRDKKGLTRKQSKC